MTQPAEPVNPPVRMAWHDPAPSLAEKARADEEWLAQNPAAERALAEHNAAVRARQPVTLTPDRYAAMLAVVQAARAWAGPTRLVAQLSPCVVTQPSRDLLAAIDALPDEEATP